MAYAQFDNSPQSLAFKIVNQKTGAVLYSGIAGSIDVDRTFSKTMIHLNNVTAQEVASDKSIADYHKEYGEIWEAAFKAAIAAMSAASTEATK